MFAVRPAAVDVRAFVGRTAFADSGERFEAMKADPGVVQLWLARRDGRSWQLTARPLTRNDAGEWEEEPFPDPPDDDRAE